MFFEGRLIDIAMLYGRRRHFRRDARPARSLLFPFIDSSPVRIPKTLNHERAATVQVLAFEPVLKVDALIPGVAGFSSSLSDR